MKRKEYSVHRKNKIKAVRTIFEIIALIIITVTIIKALFSFTSYKPYNVAELGEDKGFIAVSYFGVDRNGSDTLISTKNLDCQLKALKDNGYVTITQRDIVDYYLKGRKLPEKALFLMFEDGRNDTAIFTQKIMEKYNYKATMFSYAKEVNGKNQKFLKGDDLKELEKSTFWELGTNGYRLAYINVFDKENNYIGNLTGEEFVKKSSEIDRNYNHYLMDYIRDEDNIPIESIKEMEERFYYDYNKLEEIYKENLGYIPQAYVLMHSNTGNFGSNHNASEINEKWINKLFKMNFNREGNSLNKAESSIYDLTRIEPQSYWSTNHLLMRINYDVNGNMKFVTGDEKRAEAFEEINGKAEFSTNEIILTSEVQGNGLLKLKKSDNYKDMTLSCEMAGNLIGSQSIYLYSDEGQNNCLKINFKNNIITVVDKNNDKEEILCTYNMGNNEQYDIKDAGNISIMAVVNGNRLTLKANNIVIGENIPIQNKKGFVYLESAWTEYGYSQRNITDYVYDGRFKDLYITDNEGKTLYDNRLNSKEKIIYGTKDIINRVVNWFVENL